MKPAFPGIRGCIEVTRANTGGKAHYWRNIAASACRSIAARTMPDIRPRAILFTHRGRETVTNDGRTLGANRRRMARERCVGVHIAFDGMETETGRRAPLALFAVIGLYLFLYSR